MTFPDYGRKISLGVLITTPITNTPTRNTAHNQQADTWHATVPTINSLTLYAPSNEAFAQGKRSTIRIEKFYEYLLENSWEVWQVYILRHSGAVYSIFGFTVTSYSNPFLQQWFQSQKFLKWTKRNRSSPVLPPPPNHHLNAMILQSIFRMSWRRAELLPREWTVVYPFGDVVQWSSF